MVQPESRLSHSIIEAIQKRGWFAFKVHGGAMMMAGLPDIIACVNGQFLGIETKLPKHEGGGNPTRRQVFVHDAIRRAHGVAVVCRSIADAESVCERLERDPLQHHPTPGG